MNKPVASVSIICANYNNGRYLEACIQSVADSTMRPAEMIVVDDGSTDHSVEIIQRLAQQHPWIKPLILDQNVGVANASNKGIAIATAKYIMRLDADDMAMPDRIEKQFNYLENNPSIDVLGGNCIYIDADTEAEISSSAFPIKHHRIKKLYTIGENGVLNGTTMVKRKWSEHFSYRQEMVWAEDYDFFARLLHAGAVFEALPEPLTLVRIHPGSATSNIRLDTLKKAWNLSKQLFNNPLPNVFLHFNYQHLYWYRKSLLTPNKTLRWLYLAFAVFFRPDKLTKRILRKG